MSPTGQKPALPRRSIGVRFALNKQTLTERCRASKSKFKGRSLTACGPWRQRATAKPSATVIAQNQPPQSFKMGNLRSSNPQPRMTAVGQKHALPRRSIAVRFTPISRPPTGGLRRYVPLAVISKIETAGARGSPSVLSESAVTRPGDYCAWLAAASASGAVRTSSRGAARPLFRRGKSFCELPRRL